MNSKDLQERFKKFALRLVPLCEALPRKKVSRIIEDQLLRSGFQLQQTIGPPVTHNQKKHLAQS